MGTNVDTEGAEPRERKPWSTPRVILTELRSAEHQVGLTPGAKTNFAVDVMGTPSGSTGS